MKKTLLSLSIFALAACGGGNGDKSNLLSNGGMSNIIGVWDGTENLGDEGIDEGYVVIDKNGLVTFYDYAGDSYDQEGNCYWIGIGQLKSLGDNNFEYTPLGRAVGEEPEVLKMIRDGDKLTVDTNDPEDEDEDVETYIKSNKSVSNFTPECTDSSARASSKASSGIQTFERP
jgi:hypothetical protein